MEASLPGSVCLSEQNTLLASLYTSTIPGETDGVYMTCSDFYPKSGTVQQSIHLIMQRASMMVCKRRAVTSILCNLHVT